VDIELLGRNATTARMAMRSDSREVGDQDRGQPIRANRPWGAVFQERLPARPTGMGSGLTRHCRRQAQSLPMIRLFSFLNRPSKCQLG